VTREVRRVEPVATPFVLPAAKADESRLRSRVIFLALPQEPLADQWRDRLAEAPGCRVLPAPSRLFAGALDFPWRAFQLPSDVGLGALVTSSEFLGLLRGLADDLLVPEREPPTGVVDWTPEHADAKALEVLASVYPDAIVVVDAGTAASLDDELRQRVVVADGPPPASLDQVESRREAAARIALPQTDRWRDRLVVIVGCGRSGTTWLEEMWLSHPDVGGLSGHESWLFHQTRHLWREFGRQDEPGLSAWLDRDAFVRAIRRYCDGVFAAAADRHAPGCRFFVEKTPVHSERLAEIAASYPDAWVVHLLRDGRDVARSISQVPFFNMPDPGDAAAVWARVVTTVHADAAAVPRFREVRYEALVADPVGVMTELAEWVGLDVDDGWRDALAAVAAQRVSTHAGTATATGAGSWRALGRRDLAVVYDRAGRELVAEGYATRTEVWRSLAGRKVMTAIRKAPGLSIHRR
jgi:LPS sulfotransferase NodH